MDFFFKSDYTESDWRRDADARELAERAIEARDLADYTVESTPRQTLGKLARIGCCDGSGFFEQYIGVDQTRATECPGCPACVEEPWAVGSAGLESEIERSIRRAPVMGNRPLGKIA
jgi:hypothetical protein